MYAKATCMRYGRLAAPRKLSTNRRLGVECVVREESDISDAGERSNEVRSEKSNSPIYRLRVAAVASYNTKRRSHNGSVDQITSTLFAVATLF